ncbi:MAG: cell division protein FtsA [Gemmatimonadales bacterium]|jgi:cell division protein FtsA|nr:cell division protein FtsA [Gemmatimonadales bacterium]MDG2238938.1 cell division protein FtsA [Longimicrobiales bacterium]NCG32239.1 cell division protein FtsA [Pseudomonadota bacterium]MBT3775092.1 cell division protein FtsA [Gemmatimonadales bacterium]MBT3958348.1 cell division protein FtsA [Gemmatimonadales bacterium]
MRSNLICGLDIGTTKTCAVIGEIVGDPRRPGLTILGVGQARTGGLRGDRVTNIEEMTESVRKCIQEAELMAGASVDRVYAGIGGDHIRATNSMGVVAVPEEDVTLDDVKRCHIVARAVALPPDREMLHAIPQEYLVDHQRGIKDPLGMAGVRLEAEVFLVTAAITASANIRKAVNRAGYRVQELVLEPLAGARAVLTEDEKEVGVAMVEIGASTTDVAAYYEGKVQHVAILPFGGNTLTQDLVRGLSVPYAEAQKAKEHYGTAFAQLVDPRETVEMPGPSPGQMRAVARELIAHIVEQRLDEMFGLVQGELQDNDLLDKLGAGVVLTGGTVAMPGIMELAQQIFASPVRLGVPGEGLAGLADSVARPRFSVAAGLALWGADRFAETGRGASTVTSGMFTKLGTWLKEFF